MTRDCDRARQWASLELDGELSELGRVRLAAHLGRCPACAEYARVQRAYTERLRSTPLVVPERPAALPSRLRPRIRAVQIAAAAAAIAVGVSLGTVAGSLSSHSGNGGSTLAAAARSPEQPLLAMLIGEGPNDRSAHGRVHPI